ncbi:unnamed protein product [Adineta ricciae]|uniref:VPS37 C-terminal domain-containing protein n=1 Tax=Adineta ricciae TaxID=249248 RepID=A0A815W9W2_ADIRI|nr:unnamed protein product [Adineta ricciae]
MGDFYTNNDSIFNEAQRLVERLSDDELKNLMTNDAEVTKFVQNLPEVQRLESIRESLRENNKRLAEENLKQQPNLAHEKKRLVEIHEQLRKMKEEYNSIRAQYDDQGSETNPEIAYVLLQTAASDLERKTEQTAEDFFYGGKTEDEVTDFERRFIEDRKRAHELKIKADKFQELLHVAQSTSSLNYNQPSRTSGYL